MILHFVKINGLLRFPKAYSGQCPSQMIKYINLFWGVGGPKMYQKNKGFGGSKFDKFSKFQKVEI